jgi:hypothetical protein
MILLVLDPRISYEGLLNDSHDDPSALNHLELSKAKLEAHYQANYAQSAPTPTRVDTTSSPALASPASPPKVDFTARYRRPARDCVNELQDYFKLPQEDFGTCDIVKWWAGRCAQFPNLSRLARDILSIPGMFYLVSLSTSL